MSLWTTKAHDLRKAQADQLADLARSTEPELPPIRFTGVTAPGDERRLRGIPAIGRGVAGAINGTRPGANLR